MKKNHLFWVHNGKDVSWASLNVSMCLYNGHLGERGKWPLREVWSVQLKTTLSSNLCRERKPSKSCQNVPIQLRTLEENTKNHLPLTWKFSWKSFFTTHPELPTCTSVQSNSSILDWSIPKNFLHRNEATIKVQNAECVTVKPKNYFEILLPAHAELQKLIFLHPKQKVVKASTYKRYCGQFWFIIARQWQKNRLLNFKRPFFWHNAHRNKWVKVHMKSVTLYLPFL